MVYHTNFNKTQISDLLMSEKSEKVKDIWIVLKDTIFYS